MEKTNCRLLNRGVSLFVAMIFILTTLIGNPSQAVGSSAIFAMRSQPGLLKDLYAMPADLGSLISIWEPPIGMGSKDFVIQVQDAHANPEGQMNVAGMLNYLEENHKIVVGLEGAVGKLHPEYLDFFKEFPDANRAVVEDLKQKGELNGAELYLLQKTQKGQQSQFPSIEAKRRMGQSRLPFMERNQKSGQTTDHGPQTKGMEVSAVVFSSNSDQLKRSGNWGNPGYQPSRENNSQDSRQSSVFGIEDADLYRENLKSYRDLLSKRDDIHAILNSIRAMLEKESSQKLNGELRNFLKERSRRKDGRFGIQAFAQTDPDLQAYVRYLRKQSLKLLEIDLKDPIEQLRFPSLFRVIMVEEAQKGFDVEKAKSQWEAASRLLKAKAQDKNEKEFVEAFTAFGSEKGFISKPEGKAFNDSGDRALYPRKLLEELFRFAKQHQLSFDGQEAFWQSWKLAVLQAEIDVTELLKEMSTLEEGLIQKLAHSENEKALVRKLENFELLEKMLRLELSREEYNSILSNKDRLKSFVSGSKPLAAALDKADHFYAVSLQRDEALVTNLLALSPGTRTPYLGTRETRNPNESRVSNPESRIFVLYSGGFHTPGILEQLRSRNIGYAVFSPRITKTDHGDLYQKVMSGANADLSAYFNVRNPFSTKQEALFFKQLIETAAPMLSKKYHQKPSQIAENIAQAVSLNPVLSGTLKAERQKENPSTVRFSPQAPTTPSNSAVMSLSITSGRAETRLLDSKEASREFRKPVVISFDPVPSICRAETRVESAEAPAPVSAEGKATRAGKVVGRAVLFSSSLTEEILFPAIPLFSLKSDGAEKLIVQFDELVNRVRAGIESASEGEERRMALSLINRYAGGIREQWKVNQEALAIAEKKHSEDDEAYCAHPFSALIRNIRDAREVDAKSTTKSLQKILNLLLDQVRAATYTRAENPSEARDQKDLSEEEKEELRKEIKKTGAIVFGQWSKLQSMVDIGVKAEKTFAAVQARHGRARDHEALEKIEGVVIFEKFEYAHAVEQIKADFLEKIYSFYFDENRIDKTLERMREYHGDFAALFYNEILREGVKEINEGMSLFKYRRRMSSMPFLKKAADDMISAADDILVDLYLQMGQKRESYSITESESEEGSILVVRESMPASKAVDFYEKHGGRIKAIVFTKETDTSHAVIILKGKGGMNPPLIVTIDGDQYPDVNDIKSGDKLMVEGDSSDVGKIYKDPSPEQIEEAEQDSRDLAMVERARRRMDPLPSGKNKVLANVVPGEPFRIMESGADGKGLDRTEIDKRAEEYMIELAKLPVESEEFHKKAELLQAHLEKTYKVDSKDPALRGKPNTYRAFDLWPDKNQDLFDMLKLLKQPRNGGFDFFREPLGKEILQRQVAAFLVVEARLGRAQDSERVLTRLLFPHVNSAADARYLSEEILPGARRYAAISLDSGESEISEAERHISYGAMIETPEAVDAMKEILGFRSTENGPRLFKFFSVGTNDLEIGLLSKFFDEKLSRDFPWVAKYLKKLYPLYLQEYKRIIQTAKDFNRELEELNREHPKRPAEELVEGGFCGEVAGTDEFLFFLQSHDEYASMSPSQVRRAKTLLRLPIGQELKKIFDETLLPATAAIEEQEAYHQKIASLVADKVRRLENTLLFIERWQERYELAGMENVQNRIDIDVINGIGSFGDFNFLRGMLESVERSRFSGDDEMNEADLNLMLVMLEEREITVPEDGQSIRDAYHFLRDVYHAWKRLQANDSEGIYAGQLTPDLVPSLLEAMSEETRKGGPAPDQQVSEFYHRYHTSAAAVFRTTSQVITYYAREVVPPKVLDEKQLLPQTQGKEINVIGRWIEGPVFTVEQGLAYGKYDFWEYERERFFDDPVEAMNFLRLTAEELDRPEWPRIGQETQRKIRQGRESFEEFMSQPSPKRNKVYESFKGLLEKNSPLGYLISQLNSSRLLSALLPGFREILFRILGHARFYLLHSHTVRAFSVMEQLPNHKNFVFAQASETFLQLRAQPVNIRILRLAMLLLDIVKYRWEIKSKELAAAGQSFSDEARDAWVEEQVGEILSKMNMNENTTRESVAWLVSQNLRQGIQDILSSLELAKELLTVVRSLKREGHETESTSRVEASDLLKMLYVMKFVQRYAVVSPEKQALLTEQGFNSPLPNIDKYYLYAFNLLSQDSLMPVEELANVIHIDFLRFQSGESPVYVNFGAFTGTDPIIQTLKTAAQSEESWNVYCSRLGLTDIVQKTVVGGFEALRQEVLRLDFRTQFNDYLKGFTPYRAKSLSPEALVREWVLLRHLQSLSSYPDNNLRHETVIPIFERLSDESQMASPVPFRIVFGTGYWDKDMERIYTRILKEHGFDIVTSWTSKFDSREEKSPAITVVVGFFKPQPHIPVSRTLNAIKRDLNDIFKIKPTWTGAFKTVLDKYLHSNLLSGLDAPGRRAERKRRIYEKYGRLVVEKPRGAQDIVTKVDFVGERLRIKTSDRPGLMALILAVLEQRFDLLVTNQRLNDDFFAECSFQLAEWESGTWHSLSPRKKGVVTDTLKKMLDSNVSIVEMDGTLMADGKEVRSETRVPDPEPSPSAPAFNRVLLVDDDEMIRSLMPMQLGRLGISRENIQVATNGKEALEFFSTNPEGFDLIITDVQMPGMNGLELVLKAIKIKGKIPVLFMSGYANVDFNELEGQVVFSWLQKPFGMEKLKDALSLLKKKADSQRSEVRSQREPRQSEASGLGIQPDRFHPRSEFRVLVSTGKYRESLLPPAAAPDLLPMVSEIDSAAGRIGLYSIEEIAAELEGGITEESLRKACVWIAYRLIKEIGDQNGSIENTRLQGILESLFATLPKIVQTAITNPSDEGPKFHINLMGLNEHAWDELLKNFPVVIGLLLTLRASISINVDAEGEALIMIQEKFNKLLKKERIVLARGQLVIVNAGHDGFKSFEGQKEADAFMARDAEWLRRRRNVHSYWLTDDRGRMELLASGIATALLEVASDKKLNTAATYKPADFESLMATVLHAIENYLHVQTAA